MNYYDIGVELALEKLATSRWREAIRSGEISPWDADELKERMGFDPERHAKRMMHGARQRAAAHGYKFYEHTPKAYKGELGRLVQSTARGFREKGLRGAGRAVQQWAPGFGERALGLLTGVMGGGGGANPALQRIDLVPGMVATKGGTMPIVAGHEAGEAAEMRRYQRPMDRWYRQITGRPDIQRGLARLTGGAAEIGEQVGRLFGKSGIGGDIRYNIREMLQKGWDPAVLNPDMPEGALRQFVPYAHTSQHASAMPPIQDIREGRLLGGKGQRTMEALRRATGEYDTMLMASVEGAPRVQAARAMGEGSALRLPRHRLRQIANAMERLNLAEGAAIAEGEAGPVASRVARGIARLRKLLGR